jgi:hypothetical protein
MAEPILWGNIARRTLERRDERGRRIIERVPQTATVGDYDDPRRADPRYRIVVDSYGNELRVVITTAAADVSIDGNYARRQRQKWRVDGWYEKGSCPVALYLAGDLQMDHLVATDVVAAAKERRACDPTSHDVRKPCPHALAELDARRVRNAEEDAERQKNFRSESDKLIEANAKNSADIISGVAGAMAGAIKEAVTAATSSQGKEKK